MFLHQASADPAQLGTFQREFLNLTEACARGLVANLGDTWRALQADSTGLEVVINKAGAGAPSQRFCRAYASTLPELIRLTKQQQRWQPDVSYCRLNPSNRSLAPSWHSISRNDGVGKHDITHLRAQLIDPDPPLGTVIATANETLACFLTAMEIRAFIGEVLGTSALDAIPYGFSGRGCFDWLLLDALENSPRNQQLIYQTYAGLASRFGSKACDIDTTVTDASRLGTLPGVLKRKAGAPASAPFRQTGIVVPVNARSISQRELETLHAAIGIMTVTPESEPQGLSLVAVVNDIPGQHVCEWLGGNPAAPDCPVCKHLSDTGQLTHNGVRLSGGFGGNGVKWLPDSNALYCHHYSCRRYREAQGDLRVALSSYQQICWTLVGKGSKDLNVYEREIVRDWIYQHTDAVTLLADSLKVEPPPCDQGDEIDEEL